MLLLDINWTVDKESTLHLIKYHAYFIKNGCIYTKMYSVCPDNSHIEYFIEQYPKAPRIFNINTGEILGNLEQITEEQYLTHYKDPWEIEWFKNVVNEGYYCENLEIDDPTIEQKYLIDFCNDEYYPEYVKKDTHGKYGTVFSKEALSSEGVTLRKAKELCKNHLNEIRCGKKDNEKLIWEDRSGDPIPCIISKSIASLVYKIFIIGPKYNPVWYYTYDAEAVKHFSKPKENLSPALLFTLEQAKNICETNYEFHINKK